MHIIHSTSSSYNNCYKSHSDKGNNKVIPKLLGIKMGSICGKEVAGADESHLHKAKMNDENRHLYAKPGHDVSVLLRQHMGTTSNRGLPSVVREQQQNGANGNGRKVDETRSRWSAGNR